MLFPLFVKVRMALSVICKEYKNVTNLISVTFQFDKERNVVIILLNCMT